MAYAQYYLSQKGKATASPSEVHRSSRFLTSSHTENNFYGKIHGNYRRLPLPRQNFYKSQPSEAKPKPAPQVTTVKPAQFEKGSSGSAMASNPSPGSTTTSRAVGSSFTPVERDPSAGRAKEKTNTTLAGATVVDMSSTEATVLDMTSAGFSSGPTEMSQATSVSQVKTPATVPSSVTGKSASTYFEPPTAVTKPKESLKDTAKPALPVTTIKADLTKVESTKTSKPAAAMTVAADSRAAQRVTGQDKKEGDKRSPPKVQVETAVAGAKQAPEVDPFDALASILPSAESVALPQPVYTGPEVKEHDVVSEEGVRCGEKDATLPPGYRFEDMTPPPADWKPKDVPKPISTDEALDSLLAGFESSTAPAATKTPEKKDIEVVSASSAKPSHFAPPPLKKPEAPAAAPPAGGTMQKDDFSLEDGLSFLTSQTAAPVAACMAPADKKPKLEKPKVDTKPKSDDAASLSLGAINALVDTLPADTPKPALPELRPKDIVSEEKHKKEKGIRVGETDDTIPPEYRFDKDKLKELPAPKPEPTMDTKDALNMLSEDFMDSSVAPAVQAPVLSSTDAKIAVCMAPPPVNSGPDVKSVKALDVQRAECLAAPIMPKGPEQAKIKEQTKPVPRTDAAPLPLDALGALCDTLPADVPKPKLPEVKPQDMVSEEKHKKDIGALEGESDDTIPPEYRFDEDKLKQLPAPKLEPPMDTGEALDILSGDLNIRPAVQAPVSSSSASSVKASSDKALAALADDFVTSTKATAVKSEACFPKTTEPQHLEDAGNALDALSDTLESIKPVPQPQPVPAKDIVTEKKIVEERLIKMGEKDDSLPPEYRPTEEDLKAEAEAKAKAAAAPKKKGMDDSTALDLLSSELSSPSPSVGVAATKLTPTVPDKQSMPGSALDSMAEKLLPEELELKSKTEKSKKPQADLAQPTDQLQSPSKVVSTTKKGGRS